MSLPLVFQWGRQLQPNFETASGSVNGLPVSLRMSSLDSLNPAQRDAATTLSGPLLVLAGAGTGKTRVITHRMVELIRGGTPPERILSVTFTNKAAREMLERTNLLLKGRLKKKPIISTFHSLCVKILREEIEVLGYPRRFTIFDRGDQESAARTALRDIRVGEQALKPAEMLSLVSQWKSSGVQADRAREAAENDREFLAAMAYRRYQQNLRASGGVDFDDLLLLTRQLFREHPEVMQRQRDRFAHVQIDEYQDTNGIQFELVEALVGEHKNICVVGDDDQSIYGWRGAEVKHILGFQHCFPGAKVVRLEENYRCTKQILELANELVRHNRGRHEKTLVAHKSSPHPVRFIKFDTEVEEAEKVVGHIHYLVNQKGVPPGDFAILFRTNEQPRIFETELRRRQLPYLLLGTQSFFDRREIRDLMAYLKVLSQPSDEISLLRIINTPTRGIGAGTVQKLIARAVQQGTSLWDVLPAAESAGEVPQAASKSIAEFRGLIEKQRSRFEESSGNLGHKLQDLIDDIGYEREIERQYKEPSQRVLRMSMLEELVEAVKQYEAQAQNPSLHEFLDETALGGRDIESDKEAEVARDAVKLMTLHSAKGLEFPRVYLVGLEEGILPHRRSVEGTEANIEEERRLAYVGITRACDHLAISRSTRRTKWGKARPTLPSRFLFEMRGGAPEEDDETEDEQ